eukprot:5713499-Amphidinium_carterae.1
MNLCSVTIEALTISSVPPISHRSQSRFRMLILEALHRLVSWLSIVMPTRSRMEQGGDSTMSGTQKTPEMWCLTQPQQKQNNKNYCILVNSHGTGELVEPLSPRRERIWAFPISVMHVIRQQSSHVSVSICGLGAPLGTFVTVEGPFSMPSIGAIAAALSPIKHFVVLFMECARLD